MLIFAYCMFLMKGNTNQHFILYILYLFPFMNIDIIPGVHSMSIFEVSTILFIIAFYKPKRSKIRNIGYIHLIIFIIIIAIIVGCFLAETITENTVKAIIQIGTVILYSKIVFEETIIDHAFIEKILKAVRMCLLFSFLFLVAQILFGSGISLSKSENINVAGGETIRFPSFFQDPQKYAQYLAMTGLLMFIPIENDKNWSIIMKLLPYATIVAILITGSRAALGGMFIGLAYIYLKKGRALFFIIISFIMAIIVMTVGKNLPVFKRASLSESYDFRNNIWNDAIEIYKIHPIWGIGAGNYSEYVRIHHPDQYWMGDNEMIFFDHPESGYLKWLIEFGTIGFLAFLSLILIPLIRSFFIRHNESCSILAATLISWLIGFYTLYSLGDLRIGIVVAVTTTLLMAENIISKNESLIRRKPFY